MCGATLSRLSVRYPYAPGLDIAAKGDSSATDAQLRLMIQTLLADRFRLKVHPETRELPVYALVVSKDGHKLRPNNEAPPPSVNTGPGLIDARKISILNLARLLAPRLDRPVIDRTNLAGRFDFKLEWAPESSGDAPADTSAPSLFTALQGAIGFETGSPTRSGRSPRGRKRRATFRKLK